MLLTGPGAQGAAATGTTPALWKGGAGLAPEAAGSQQDMSLKGSEKAGEASQLQRPFGAPDASTVVLAG